jgi:hypothetical protein
MAGRQVLDGGAAGAGQDGVARGRGGELGTRVVPLVGYFNFFPNSSRRAPNKTLGEDTPSPSATDTALGELFFCTNFFKAFKYYLKFFAQIWDNFVKFA